MTALRFLLAVHIDASRHHPDPLHSLWRAIVSLSKGGESRGDTNSLSACWMPLGRSRPEDIVNGEGEVGEG